MTVNEIRPLLQKFKTVGKGQYMACCPAHDDRNPSLSITETDNGHVLLNCFAGCRQEDIADALGISAIELKPGLQNGKGGQTSKRRSNQAKKETRKPIAEYIYRDIDGNPIMKKIKFAPTASNKKPFDWKHIEAGQWRGKRGGAPVLYNLHLLKNRHEIWVAEGEKDADNLTRIGFAAVSVPDGAGRGKWKPQYTEALSGKKVVVMGDNDEIGKAFAVETCNALSGHAESVKLLDLSAVWKMENKEDISDILSRTSVDEVRRGLLQLEADTPEYTRQEMEETATDEKDIFFESGAFRHNLMGDYLIQKYNVCKINGALHIYDNGIYKQGEAELYGRMIELYPRIKETQRKEVYKYLKASLKVPEKKPEPPFFIPFATRIYNINTGVFLDYSPEYVFLNRFPYDYKPEAPEVPLVVDTIREIADNNPEIERLIYEAIGNCFYLANLFRGAVILYGGGKNGKSTLLNLILQVIGKENASTLSLQNFSERFMVAGLYGKAANIGDDIPSDLIRDTSNFKKAVTGEYIQAERKGQDPFSFIPYAKLFFSMNELPPVRDKTAGFFSRVILVPLLHAFEQGKNADNLLKSRTWTQSEMECLVKLAVEGLQRLLRNGAFTVPEVAKEALDEYETENNPVKEFLGERDDIKLPKPIEELYSEFDIWCARAGHRTRLTRCRFSREVIKLTGWKSWPVRHPYFNGELGRCFVTNKV